MDFKFIVLALCISLAAGEEKKIESPLIKTNDKVIELNTNEELHNVKDHVTPEKPMHDVKNIADEKPRDLLPKPVIDINKSSEDSNVVGKNTSSVPSSMPAPTSAPITTTTPAPETTTTPAPKTTTTPAPKTTTTPAPKTTTTSAPTVAPVPEEGTWTVSNNSVCIVMQMEIVFNITYPGNKDVANNRTVYIPKTATASGHCGETSQEIDLKWGLGNVFEISFALNKTMGKFHINSLNLTVNSSDFKNIPDGKNFLTYLSKKPDFPLVPVKMSYKCDKQLKQILQSSDKYNATLLVSHTQFQAFSDNKTAFGEVKDCDEFDTPDIVPIAVGCVLSILVVIVLVAYLIGRRRSQSRGYLSM